MDSNQQWYFDPEARHIEFSFMGIDAGEALPDRKVGNNVAGQNLRSGTSPAPKYAEATSVQSRQDFIRKMKVALKEKSVRLGVILALVLLALSDTTDGQSKYQTLGPSGCGIGQDKCHATENGLMIDQHKTSADNIRDAENSQKYADALGIKDFVKGASRCMECHGTIVSGKEGKEVEEGVSCESCHGPGSAYKDPHSEGPKGGEGIPRPGYAKGVSLGLADLKKPEEIARMCVRCHYTTDQKLLAAGHPDGGKFTYPTKMKSVTKHWRYREKGNIPATGLFNDAKARKGPGAKLALAPNPTAQQTSVQMSTGTSSATVTQKTPTRQQGNAPATQQQEDAVERNAATPPARIRKQPPPPKPVAADLDAAPPLTPVALNDLPPFPTITDSTRVDQMLLLLKRRLELLYMKTKN